MGKALSGFLTVRYEEGHNAADAVIERFGVFGFPTLLVLDADGRELDQVWGNTPELLIEDLKRVARGEETLPTLRGRVAEAPDDFEAIAALAEKLSDRYAREAVKLVNETLARIDEENREAAASLLLSLATAEGQLQRAEASLDAVERLITEYADTESAGHAVFVVTNNFPVIDPLRGLILLERALSLTDDEHREYFHNVRGHLLRRAWEDSMRKEAETRGDDPEHLNYVAWECFERGLLIAEATAWAEKALKLSGRAPNILDTLANLYFKQGRIDEALKLEAEALMKLAEDDPNRAAFEECFAKFHAVKVLRERRKAAAR